MNETRQYDVLVIGAGASGIGAAIRLRQAGRDFAVLEKADDLGGTWRDNSYPGCACDVPSALYSYSFAPNPEWTRAFAAQAEIQAYLRTTAERYDVQSRIRFGVELERADWDESAGLWRLETTDGPYAARILISGTGPWHQPLIPEIAGLSEFTGEVWHSSRWNHSYDLKAKRVAVIGTGASAVQFVPKIQPSVAELHLFQRTAQWVLPKPDHYVPQAERWLMRSFPAAQRALRSAEYAGMELLGLGFRHPWLLRQVQRVGRLHLRRAVRDPLRRAALMPDYTLGCKRLLLSNDYYPAVAASNVVVHPGLRVVDGNKLVDADGNETVVDAIILGTGFHILDLPIAHRVYDADGQSLAEHWKGSPQAYLGTTVKGFPNAFLLLGPSLGTGHTSAFMILEAQLRYALGGVEAILRGDWHSAEIRPEAQDAFNAEVQEGLAGTVYETGGCASYYHDANGRNSFSWPWSTARMRRRIRDFDPADYLVSEKAGVR
ncbi:NAD(P)/FAD-dependent oxidoreductase [Kribbella sp. NBC_01245]|uniref:flavin-containing monooxygenase n=1 Tax=Kribbella sp. NBC_01245 TaxID=2903578 RepID=UPI002E27D116|nr:NAD(P)/FAD-dependent oxidoreductase [Kribbella sp. NBC_01245]